MGTNDSAVAKSIAAADKRLDNMSVLCGILAGRIEASRRDLRQIRSDVAAAQKHQEQGHAVPSDISADMLAG
jgi:hypothetical protein